jgi:hypothetical protein
MFTVRFLVVEKVNQSDGKTYLLYGVNYLFVGEGQSGCGAA